jgi:hypothetical protein
MKLKKTIYGLSTILGVGIVGAGVATTFTSCSNNISNVKAEIIDDYEINQAKYDIDEIAGMIISPRASDMIVSEHNGVMRKDLNMNEINLFFDQLTNVVNKGLESQPTVH